MQTPEAITQSNPSAQANIVSWQWEVSHFMPTERGIMAFVPAGPMELDEDEVSIKVLRFSKDPHVVGLEYKGIVVPLDASLLEHLIDAGRKNGGKTLISLISLPRDVWIATPLVGFEVEMEELERLRRLVAMEIQA